MQTKAWRLMIQPWQHGVALTESGLDSVSTSSVLAEARSG